MGSSSIAVERSSSRSVLELTKEQVLDVVFNHVNFSDLSNGIGAIHSFNLLFVVLMAETG
jgi:hypothetical protein